MLMQIPPSQVQVMSSPQHPLLEHPSFRILPFSIAVWAQQSVTGLDTPFLTAVSQPAGRTLCNGCTNPFYC